MITDLEAAQKETQFEKAVRAVKHGIPPALLIDGHNPLTLLHNALSDGLHGRSDEECLAIAQSIRVVLETLCKRIAIAVTDQSELTTAVSALLAKKSPAAPAVS